MSEQRYEPQAQHSVSQQGGNPDGRGEVHMVPEEEVRNYYGRPILKEPTWTWQIPWYFFAGGLFGPRCRRAPGGQRAARASRPPRCLGRRCRKPSLADLGLGKAGSLLQHAQGL